MPPHRRSAGSRDGGCGRGGQRRIVCAISSVLATQSTKFQTPPIANTSPASTGPTARAAL
jgi:hypothetical protein